MAHYNSKFPKRHHAWSNSREIRLFDMGVLCREYQRKLATLGVKSSKTYISGGRKRYVGTKHLKGSESGPWCVSTFQHICQCFFRPGIVTQTWICDTLHIYKQKFKFKPISKRIYPIYILYISMSVQRPCPGTTHRPLGRRSSRSIPSLSAQGSSGKRLVSSMMKLMAEPFSPSQNGATCGVMQTWSPVQHGYEPTNTSSQDLGGIFSHLNFKEIRSFIFGRPNFSVRLGMTAQRRLVAHFNFNALAGTQLQMCFDSLNEETIHLRMKLPML